MRGNPEREQKRWLDKLAEADRKRVRYQEMAAGDLITFDELRARLAEADKTRSIAERELQALRSHKELVGELEADRDSLLDSLTGTAPNALDSLAPEERHHVYKMLKLRVTVSLDGTLEVSGAFGDAFAMCNLQTGSGSPSGRSSSGISSGWTWASTSSPTCTTNPGTPTTPCRAYSRRWSGPAD